MLNTRSAVPPLHFTAVHLFRGRRDVVEHLLREHDWDVALMPSDKPSPDPLGWHTPEGGYLVTDAELLAIHRELEALRAAR